MSDTVHSMMKHIDISQWRSEIQDEFHHEVERLQHLPSLSEVRWVVDWHWILGAAIAVAACFLRCAPLRPWAPLRRGQGPQR